MSVYQYIAEHNPMKANDFCLQNGLDEANSPEELSNNLVAIVAQNGELAFKKIMELHHDKDVIIELFQPKTEIEGIKEITKPPMMISPSYMNATGNTVATSKDTNTMILIAALIISVAVISIK